MILGNYTCYPHNSKPAHIQIHVLRGLLFFYLRMFFIPPTQWSNAISYDNKHYFILNYLTSVHKIKLINNYDCYIRFWYILSQFINILIKKWNDIRVYLFVFFIWNGLKGIEYYDYWTVMLLSFFFYKFNVDQLWVTIFSLSWFIKNEPFESFLMMIGKEYLWREDHVQITFFFPLNLLKPS